MDIHEYITEDSTNPYQKWFDTLNPVAAAKITVAKARLALGHVSNIKWFDGIGECRIDWGPGYRIYLAQDGKKLIVLFGGSTKKKNSNKILKKPKNYCRNTNSERKKQQRKRFKNMSTLTRDFKDTVTVTHRLNQDPAFAIALLDEAISLFLSGEPDTARLVLRDIVHATVGFESLAIKTEKPSKSLHRMLSANGNPTMNNLTNIIGVLKQALQVNIEVNLTHNV